MWVAATGDEWEEVAVSLERPAQAHFKVSAPGQQVRVHVDLVDILLIYFVRPACSPKSDQGVELDRKASHDALSKEPSSDDRLLPSLFTFRSHPLRFPIMTSKCGRL